MDIFVLPFALIIIKDHSRSFITDKYIPGREFSTTLCTVITMFAQRPHKISV